MKIRRFFIRYCDQLTRVQFWLAILVAGLFGTGAGMWFGTYQSNQQGDKRVSEIQLINLGLMKILQDKIVPLVSKSETIVDQQSDIVQKQVMLTEKIESTTEQAESSATKATKAANRAASAVRRSREPVPTLKIVPNKPVPKKCFNGRDVFGDQC